MNKSEFVARVAEKTGQTKAAVAKMIEAYNETVTEALKKGEKVQFVGFGTYQVNTREARKGRNPSTGEAVDIPAKKVPVFKAGTELKHGVQ